VVAKVKKSDVRPVAAVVNNFAIQRKESGYIVFQSCLEYWQELNRYFENLAVVGVVDYRHNEKERQISHQNQNPFVDRH
jgi:hypothetical protein